MELYELIEKYGKGKGETVMWETTRLVSDFIKPIKETNKQEYWNLMRKVYGLMSGGHYDEVWANHDVSQIEYTDKEGKKRTGAYWTCEQIEEATKGMTFPSGTTKYDKFVAFNFAWSDFCKKFDDSQILQIGYLFFFADEDWSAEGKGSSTKVFEYVCCKYKNYK